MFKIGYYTYFNLSVRNADDIPIERQREASFALVRLFGWSEENDAYYKERIDKSDYPFDWVSDDSMKWYDWERDMSILAKDYPEMEFVLYGEGEERDDNWRAFFKGDKTVFQMAHIYYDPEPDFGEGKNE